MAQTEEIVILNVQTGEAVQNMADLKNNVSILKKELDTLEIGSQEYQNTLDELKLNQNALKDAMYATSSSMADVTNSAAGMNESYNSLVHRMASLKEEFRSTTDVMRRAELGQQIKAVNDQLKDLDAMQGNFQRSVGDYTNAIKQAFEGADLSGSKLGKTIKTLDTSTRLMSSNPLFGIVTLLLPVITKITEELKGNTTAVEAVDKAMTSLKPVTDFFSRVIQKLAEFLSDLITKVSAFVSENGLIQKVIKGMVGIGNSILQFVIAPFKGVIEAIKVLKEQGVKGVKDAAKALVGEMKSGVSFKQNFEAGQAVADAIVKGANSKKKEVVDAVSSAVKEGVETGLADIDKALAEGERRADAATKERMDAQKELDESVQEDLAATNAYVDEVFNEIYKNQAEEARIEEENRKKAEETAKAKIDTLFAVADATSSILGTIADMYEENAENDAEAAEKAKNIRIAGATIDTISGAIGAFMQSVKSIPAPFGAIVGAAQAAAVTAAGVANIAKIRSTNISSRTGGNVPTIDANVPAPSVSTSIPQTSIINSNTQEDRLNRIASDQRVYILQSDIEAEDKSRKVRIAEATF